MDAGDILVTGEEKLIQPAPVPLCPIPVQSEMAWDLAWSSAIIDRRLTIKTS